LVYNRVALCPFCAGVKVVAIETLECGEPNAWVNQYVVYALGAHGF